MGLGLGLGLGIGLALGLGCARASPASCRRLGLGLGLRRTSPSASRRLGLGLGLGLELALTCVVSKRCGGGARVATSSGKQAERCVGGSAAPAVGGLSPGTVSGDLRGEGSAPG